MSGQNEMISKAEDVADKVILFSTYVVNNITLDVKIQVMASINVALRLIDGFLKVSNVSQKREWFY